MTRLNDRPRVGVTLVELLVVTGLLAMLLALLLPAVQRVRAAAARAGCLNNLRQCGLGLLGHEASTGHLPAGTDSRYRSVEMPWLSWQASLLPYLDQGQLWERTVAAYQVQREAVYDPPHVGLSTRLSLLICPADSASRYLRPATATATRGVALTAYFGSSGTTSWAADGALFNRSQVRLVEIADGGSQTLAAGERPPNERSGYGSWYRGYGQGGEGGADVVLGAAEFNLVERACPAGGYAFVPGRVDQVCDDFHFWSLHPGGANFAFCDGSVRFLPYSARDLLPALATRAGGEVATPD